MCLICSSFKNDELTILEAWNNYAEMAETMEPKHAEEVFAMLLTATGECSPDGKMSKPTLEKIKE